MTTAARERFKQLLSQPEAALDLAEAALVIAQEEYPELEVGAYLERLDGLADGVRQGCTGSPSGAELLFALNGFLFEEQGFSGNTDHYHDPRNSFLNKVLDERRGIPITLSVVYMEVGRRLGLPLEGVAFPGHFLVKLPVEGGEVVLDPYAGGVSLSEEDLEARLERVYGEPAALEIPLARVLGAASKREILARMLRNLRGVYFQSGQFDRALGAADRILLIEPRRPADLLERAQIHEKMEWSRAAVEDYERYLVLAPQAEEGEWVRTRVVELRQRLARLH